MRIFITGEEGFIAQNLPKSLLKLGSEAVTLNNDMNMRGTEVCVYNNTVEEWVNALRKHGVDLIIHNAAVVGTDVVALNPGESTLSNVTGTHTICRAAKRLKIPVCYIGTTVIYDTPNYQDDWITEESTKYPRTLYGIQKLAAENIVTTHCDKWLIVRPLFAYGGVGDMNSLIAKTFYSYLKNKHEKIDMFLDPAKYKDYMHVEDFCDAVAVACHGSVWNDDFNISAETPLETGAIIELMSDVAEFDLAGCVNWYPNTDYLGNHRLSSEKFRTEYGWKPNFTLSEGIQDAWKSIREGCSSYNPLKYLEQAKENNIDLTEFY
tara:strand:+ start:447 stop:1409 length:963 start_codon:yes stop_codon:yes gene_type:complete